MLQAVGIVRLIVRHGHEELRNAAGETLGQRTNAAVMDKGGGVGQQGAERSVFHREDGGGQIRRKLLELAGDEDRSFAKAGDGFQGDGEESFGLDVGAAGSEDDGFVSGREKTQHPIAERLFNGHILQGESPLKQVGRPVGLGAGEPLREEAEDAVRRIAPIPPEFAWRCDTPGLASFGHPRCSEPIRGIGQANEDSFEPKRQPAQVLHAGKENGEFVGADHDRGLDVDGDQRNPQHLPSEAGTEGGAGCEEEIRAQGLDGLGEDLRILAGVFKDELGALIHAPDTGVGDKALKIFLAAVGKDLETGGTNSFLKDAGDNHGDAVAAGAQLAGQPEEGEDVPGAAEGEEGEVHGEKQM